MAPETNPYADATGNPLAGQELDYMAWYSQHPDAYLDTLSEEERVTEQALRRDRGRKVASESFS